MRTTADTNKGIILALACAAQFMVVLDLAIVNVALPSIQKDLDIGQNALQWVIVAYGLMLGGFMLLGGRLADLLGRRRVLLAGLAVFTFASLLAGLAGSSEVLIAARALQGFGAAFLPPTALAIIAVTFTDGAERFKALGIYGAVVGISATIGVLASGLITDGPGWRWIFYINVPIGVVLIAMAAGFLPADAPERRGERVDVAGAIAVTGGLLLVVYALNRGNDQGWGSGSTIALFAAAALLLAAFVWIEARARSPLVPGYALRNRTLVAANLSVFFTFGAIFSFIFVGTLLMQQVYDYSPTRTGVAWLPMTVLSFVAAAITGTKLVALWGVRRLLIAGQLILAIAMLWLTRAPADASFATDLLPALILAGIAGGMAAPAAQIGALSGVAESLTGLASGIVETVREIGGAVAVAVVATILVSQAVEGSRVSAFHAAFWVILVVAAVGALTAAISFPRPSPQAIEPGPAAAVPAES